MANDKDILYLRELASERLGTTVIIRDDEVPSPEIMELLQTCLVGSQRPTGGWYPVDVLRALSETRTAT